MAAPEQGSVLSGQSGLSRPWVVTYADAAAMATAPSMMTANNVSSARDPSHAWRAGAAVLPTASVARPDATLTAAPAVGPMPYDSGSEAPSSWGATLPLPNAAAVATPRVLGSALS